MSTIVVQFAGDFSSLANLAIPYDIVDENLEVVHEGTISLSASVAVSVAKPGPYLVRSTLPSGERLSVTVTVPEDHVGASVPAVLTMALSRRRPPTGTSTGQGTLAAQSIFSFPAQQAKILLRYEDAVSSTDAEPPAYAMQSEPLHIVPTGASRSGGLADGYYHLQADPNIVVSTTTPPTNEEGILASFHVDRHTLEGAPSVQWTPFFQRFNVTTAAAQVDMIVAIPPLSQTDIVWVPGDQDAGPLHPACPLVKGYDARTDALLCYLTQGSFDHARRVAPSIQDFEIQEIVYQKRNDPVSAVIAVYYMLRADHVKHPDWVKNLADWFTAIPDGAVQYGWWLLRQGTSGSAPARDYFLLAAQRGIPIYSYGVRLLYDGLCLLAERNASDTEVAQAFRAIRRIASTTNWRSGITCFIGKDTTDSAVLFSG